MGKFNFSVDTLFPSNNESGSRGSKLDIDTLFINTPLNDEPDITFDSDIILKRREERRKKKLKCFYSMYKFCQDRIIQADEDNLTDIYFAVLDNIPDCPSYTPDECIEFISGKLREQLFDTLVLNDTTLFISWKYLEHNKEEAKNKNTD